MSYHSTQPENAAGQQSQLTTVTSSATTTKSLNGGMAGSKWAPEVSTPKTASLLASQGGLAASRFAAKDTLVTDKKQAMAKGKATMNAPKPTSSASESGLAGSSARKPTPAPAGEAKTTKKKDAVRRRGAAKKGPAKATPASKPSPSAAAFSTTLSLIAVQIEVAKAAQSQVPTPTCSWPQEKGQVFSTTAKDIETSSLDPSAPEFEPVQTVPAPYIPSPAAAWPEEPTPTPSVSLNPEKLSWADEMNDLDELNHQSQDHTPTSLSPILKPEKAAALAATQEVARKAHRRALLVNVFPTLSRN